MKFQRLQVMYRIALRPMGLAKMIYHQDQPGPLGIFHFPYNWKGAVESKVLGLR